MQTHALDIPVVLPSGPECGRCVSRLQDGLRLLKGVESAAVSGPRSILQIAFDPDLVTVSRIEEEARRIGADLAVDVRHETIELTNIDCPDCAASIQKDVGRLPGVLWAGANFASAQMYVEFRPDRTNVERICKVAADHGIRACALPRAGSGTVVPPTSWWDANRRLVTTIASLLLTAIGIVAVRVFPILAAPFCAAAIVTGGSGTARGAWAAVRARSLDMNVLMSIAVIGAAAVGEWTEGASVVALFSLGNLLQAGAMERTRRSIRGLLSLAPEVARIERNGAEIDLPVQDVQPGDLALVKAGERIPLDGEIATGRSAVNEAPITGESLPVEKAPGDTVFGGTLNGNGHLEVRVTRRYRDTTLARIIHRVEEAQAQRAPTQQIIDRFARIYTPLVVVLSLAVCLIPSVAVTLWDRAHGIPVPLGLWPAWFMKGLSLLIIACPCALVISTPVAIVTAIGRASRMGALVKGGSFLETIGRLRAILFDKTGTLTQGRFELVETVLLEDRLPTTDCEQVASGPSVPFVPSVPSVSTDQSTQRSYDQTTSPSNVPAPPLTSSRRDPLLPVLPHSEMSKADPCGMTSMARQHESGDAPDAAGALRNRAVRIAAALENRSEHPLAAAFSVIPGELPPVDEFESLPGLGARGRVDGGAFLIGNFRLMEQHGIDTVQANSTADRMSDAGATVIALAEGSHLVALFAVMDTARPGAQKVVRALRDLGIREMAVVTGDNARVATAVANAAGIAEVHAGLLPDEKLAIVREYHSRFGTVGMIGDGINDAPALATADVGFAMAAAGSDTAIETADVALMSNDLERLPALIRLSRRMTGIIRQNIAFSLTTKVGLLIAAVTVGLPLWLAVAGDVGVSLVVTLNSLRLRA